MQKRKGKGVCVCVFACVERTGDRVHATWRTARRTKWLKAPPPTHTHTHTLSLDAALPLRQQDETANAVLKRVEQWVAAAGVKPYNDKSGKVRGVFAPCGYSATTGLPGTT